MTAPDFIALLPVLMLAAVSVIAMLVVAFYRDFRIAAIFSAIGESLAFATLPIAASVAPRQITPLLIIDGFALFYIGLILLASLAVIALSYGYLRQHDGQQEEFYVLLLLATLGAATMAAASHFASFFLGLELLSVSLYALIAYRRTDRRPLEAGIKYLLLSASSSAFLLLGMGLIYYELGTMAFAGLAIPVTERTLFFLAGLALMLTGIGFKLAVVPFHMWAPDVYEGAPAPITAFVATVSKGAVVALLLRFVSQIDFARYGSAVLVLSLIAAASMFTGNLLALLQQNIKRILAYSSIAHLGYLLVAFLASGPLAAEAVTFYIVAYFITTLGAFGIVTVLSRATGEADAMEDYQGLFWKRPWLSATFTVMLLSLAGIPLTAGFIGKFYVIAAGVAASLWPLVLLLVVNSVIGVFYYLRLIVAMTMPVAEAERLSAIPPIRLPLAGSVVLALLTLLLVWFGVYPDQLIRVIQTMIAGLGGVAPFALL